MRNRAEVSPGRTYSVVTPSGLVSPRMPTRGPVQIGRHEDGQITVATTAAHEAGAAGSDGCDTAMFGGDVGAALGLTATRTRVFARVVRVIVTRVSRTTVNDVVVGAASECPTTLLAR